MSKSHFDQLTYDVIPLIKRFKQYEMLRWISFVQGALVARISSVEGALVARISSVERALAAPPLEVPMERQL